MGTQGLATVASYATPMIMSGLSIAAGMSPQNAAIVALSTYAIENTQRASAGPITYASCYNACMTAFALSPNGLAICHYVCLPLWGVGILARA
jgi:hypothetical protein